MTALPQIGKLVRLLASDRDGEALAAVRAIRRSLAAAGLDIHALADAVDGASLQPSQHPPVPAPPAPTRRAHRGARDVKDASEPLAMGDRVRCDRLEGVFRQCRCGSINFTIMPGVGPHLAQLVCEGCHLGGRWLSRQHFGGRP
jgi:hypothetical protein